MSQFNEIVIPEAKLTRYLLIPKPRGDKSKFLAAAGFTLDNAADLDRALRDLVTQYRAIEDRRDQYGTYYQIIGKLSGVNGVELEVITVWIAKVSEDSIQFVTLVPFR
jgi:hypothetical protein